jgi:hypothetical protein
MHEKIFQINYIVVAPSIFLQVHQDFGLYLCAVSVPFDSSDNFDSNVLISQEIYTFKRSSKSSVAKVFNDFIPILLAKKHVNNPHEMPSVSTSIDATTTTLRRRRNIIALIFIKILLRAMKGFIVPYLVLQRSVVAKSRRRP